MHLLEHIDANGIVVKTRKGWVVRKGVKRYPFSVAPFTFVFFHEDHQMPLSHIGQLFKDEIEYVPSTPLTPYVAKKGRGKKALKIYNFLKSQNGKLMSVTEIAQGLGLKRYGIQEHLESLHKDNHIRRKVRIIDGREVGLYYI